MDLECVETYSVFLPGFPPVSMLLSRGSTPITWYIKKMFNGNRQRKLPLKINYTSDDKSQDMAGTFSMKVHLHQVFCGQFLPIIILIDIKRHLWFCTSIENDLPVFSNFVVLGIDQLQKWFRQFRFLQLKYLPCLLYLPISLAQLSHNVSAQLNPTSYIRPYCRSPC